MSTLPSFLQKAMSLVSASVGVKERSFVPQPVKEAIASETPLRRVGKPEEVAGAVLFFCVDWSRFVTGTYLPVCGGSQMI